MRDLNARYADNPGLWSLDDDPSGFSWIDANDAAHNTLSFLRTDHAGNTVACVVNFSGAALGDYRIGLPEDGYWEEILNTDASAYEGSGAGNLGGVHAEPAPHHGRPYSAAITVGPRATVWFRHAAPTTTEIAGA